MYVDFYMNKKITSTPPKQQQTNKKTKTNKQNEKTDN